MKNYLITGATALALLIAFAGCSKSNDLYDQGVVDEKNKQDQEKQNQQKVLTANEAYAVAFEKVLVRLVPMLTGVSAVRVPVRVPSPAQVWPLTLRLPSQVIVMPTNT